ncbi:MAG: NAD(P)/FAD-dependent oxidoreductase [Microbacteriaceae bacterium]
MNYDVVVIGAGPAGLSAALNLVRARRRTLVLDSNRPRNAATLHSHGFLSRDGMPPHELRRLGRDEVAGYPDGEVGFALVQEVTQLGAWEDGFAVSARGIRGGIDRSVVASAVLIATGLAETLPPIANLRPYYGTHLHSCIECDGYENSDAPLALIGETDDIAERALLLGQWSSDLIVFTNGAEVVSAAEEAQLATRNILVERRAIVEITGERATMTGVLLSDGRFVPRTGGFVRPRWEPAMEYGTALGLDTDDNGLILVDDAGRTSIDGIYAAGDMTPPGPQQLIVAAGRGATVAAAINRDLIGQELRQYAGGFGAAGAGALK